MNRYCLARALFLVFAALSLAAPAWASEPSDPLTAFFEQAGPSPVATVSYTWHDEKRDRDVPVKIYFPTSGEKLPVIIFSHGLGGSREGYSHLGNQWAGHGYVSIHVTHIGSDTDVFRGQANPMEALRKSAADLRNALDRPRDVSFAIDQLARLNSDDSPLKGRLDVANVGVAGHSFGGYTTMAIAGQVFLTPAGQQSLGDPRVKAAIPMSAPAPKRMEKLDQVYGKITIPIYAMTGTLDDSPIGDTKPADRRVPYDNISQADKLLLILNGGDHMVFGGPRGKGLRAMRGKVSPEQDEVFQKLIRGSTTAFWDMTLKGDSNARQWLLGSGFREALGSNGTLEMKLLEKAGAAQ
ncbi:MAG: alpha/beta fold hydrolase [Planctomycetes bacterium]|nr:alpha/beta fold hydrolase [Planctomycetota bacterium]